MCLKISIIKTKGRKGSPGGAWGPGRRQDFFKEWQGSCFSSHVHKELFHVFVIRECTSIIHRQMIMCKLRFGAHRKVCRINRARRTFQVRKRNAGIHSWQHGSMQGLPTEAEWSQCFLLRRFRFPDKAAGQEDETHLKPRALVVAPTSQHQSCRARLPSGFASWFVLLAVISEFVFGNRSDLWW